MGKAKIITPNLDSFIFQQLKPITALQNFLDFLAETSWAVSSYLARYGNIKIFF